MTQTRQRIIVFALAAFLAIFAGCKGESPTAPPSITPGPGGSGGTAGGGSTTTPPTNATVVLSVSNATPLVNSTSVITATVSVNSQPVANGTAVQFATNFGTFNESADVTVIRTTTNGVAKATLTSVTAGVATVSATVNNVTKTTTVTFSDIPVVPPPTSTAPTISSVSPTIGLPAGGTQVTITGTNFRTPVRVLFDPANGQAPKEAFVSQVTSTSIIAIAPPIDLASGQTQAVTITVITEAGTPTEQRVSKASAFTYQIAQLTPVIRAISPTSGSIDGGTRVTITGDAFQAPIQVFFGSAQAQVLSVSFNSIDVISPTARDTSPAASGPVTGPVDIRVLNVQSGKSTTATGGFRYVAKMQITAIGPTEGPFTGGTRVTIDGTGFNEPVAVSFAGIAAQVIKVSATQIIAITGGVAIASCADVKGPTGVTNVDNGDGVANGPDWIYRVLKPVVISVTNSNPVVGGGGTTVRVANAVGIPRISIGGVAVNIVGTVVNADGTTSFSVIAPNNLTLTTGTCPQAPGVVSLQATSFDVTYTSLTTTCTDTMTKGITILPPDDVFALSPPTGFTPFTATAAQPSAVPPTPFIGSKPQQVLIANAGNAGNAVGTTPLMITSVTPVGAGCINFTITFPTLPVSLNQCDTMPLSVNFTPPPLSPSGTTSQCTLSIGTNAGTHNLGVTGSVQ